ncbi:protein ACCELERATED CELL DEATH 6-like isoform X1 [Prosopis cineraria]|uniref:protein ACCELERATED CELL DEATH 6-like isoform X1 n=1 Tax=Prosopis cineraria TaxID=364024 RepID=UPI00240F8F07|nr:protein ACCELERATED CELL DEATH 6-like isoform X1 [Prosopis cineraria]
MEERDSGRRERCYERVRQLKNRQFSASIDHRRLGDNNEDILDYELYKVVRDGNTDLDTFVNELEKVCTQNQFHVSIIFNQVSPSDDSLLHVAAEFGKAEVVELIAQQSPALLNNRNRKGDSPLHVAARAKNIEAMNVILSKCKELIPSELIELNDVGQFVTSKNNYGNTALHEAVLSEHLAGVNVLLSQEHTPTDQQASHWTWNSEHGCKSPMYLAALTENAEVLERLLQIPFSSVNDISNGDSPLHAAISKRKRDLLKRIVDRKEELIYQRDEMGNTPLHHAAHAGYVEGVGIMLDKSKMIAFKRNSEGNLPVHLACKMGHVKVVKKFLELEWFDVGLWLNNEGQNILHMAAMRGKNKMVKYLLGNPKIRPETVNEKDHNGDTPLHLASAELRLWCLYHLSQDKRINVNLENNKGLTARGIVQMKCKIPMTYDESIADSILRRAGVPVKANYLSERLVASRNTERNAKKAANTLMLAAILIATVTFAAGITVPGGFNSSEYSKPKERGKAVLNNDSFSRCSLLGTRLLCIAHSSELLFLYSSH